MINSTDHYYLDFLKNTYIVEAFIISLPLYWGVYEFKKFNYELNSLNINLKNMKAMLEDICQNNLDNYPFLKDIKIFTSKINGILNP